MADFPKRADHFKKWSQLMLEQAIVPDRPQFKTTGTASRRDPRGPTLGSKKWLRRRRKRARKKKTQD